MNKVISASLLFFLLPGVASAQTLQVFLVNFVTFLNDIVMPFLFGVAFLFFVINAVRYFIIDSVNEEGRDKAKALAIYGVAAFVFIVIFWGIINMFASSIGLDNEEAPVPDYIVNEALHNPTCSGGETSVCYNTYGVTVCRCE